MRLALTKIVDSFNLYEVLMNMNKTAPLLLCLLAMACKNKTSETTVDNTPDQQPPTEVILEQELYDDIIKLHDEVMPKLNDVMSLKGQLKEKLDIAIEEGQSETLISPLKKSIEDLEGADHAMMQWMRGFKPKSDSVSHDKVMEYYDDQYEIMKEVKSKMEVALKNAKTILKADS